MDYSNIDFHNSKWHCHLIKHIIQNCRIWHIGFTMSENTFFSSIINLYPAKLKTQIDIININMSIKLQHILSWLNLFSEQKGVDRDWSFISWPHRP